MRLSGRLGGNFFDGLALGGLYRIPAEVHSRAVALVLHGSANGRVQAASAAVSASAIVSAMSLQPVAFALAPHPFACGATIGTVSVKRVFRIVIVLVSTAIGGTG
jgi:hypothetical protein